MQANPGKFQAIVGCKKTFSELKSFSVAGDSEALGSRTGLPAKF